MPNQKKESFKIEREDLLIWIVNITLSFFVNFMDSSKNWSLYLWNLQRNGLSHLFLSSFCLNLLLSLRFQCLLLNLLKRRAVNLFLLMLLRRQTVKSTFLHAGFYAVICDFVLIDKFILGLLISLSLGLLNQPIKSIRVGEGVLELFPYWTDLLFRDFSVEESLEKYFVFFVINLLFLHERRGPEYIAIRWP